MVKGGADAMESSMPPAGEVTVPRRWHGWGGGLSIVHAAAATAVTRLFCVVLRATLTIMQRGLHGACCVHRGG